MLKIANNNQWRNIDVFNVAEISLTDIYKLLKGVEAFKIRASSKV